MNARSAYVSALAAGGVSLAILLTALPGAAADAPPAGIARALERSALSPAERTGLAARAREAADAGVPSEDVEIIIGRGLGRGADAAALGRLLETAIRTKQQGLPVRPVLDRMQQGLSKNVPLDRIDAASRRLADSLAAARPLVDGLLQTGLPAGAGAFRNAALEAVARAHEQGLPADTLRELGEEARARGQSLEQFDRAVRTLSFLAGTGMPADAAVRVVQGCIDRGLSERDHARLERTVSDMVRQGRSMDEIVRAAEREIREGRGSGQGRESGKQDRGTGSGRDAGGRGGRGR